ncbi:MAG: hypothetical protein CML81_07365 [Rhodobiaceae bacterium]|nr:hypothetical protein [Rhodobiaceae bacterium]RPF95903.1 MAG: hypothetical protein CBD87_007325 [Rhizobiales bacterium TMED227]
MDIAVTDIGSNAIKYKVFSDSGELKEYVREPLRLGTDVFNHGHIRDNTRKQLVNLLIKFKQSFDSKNISQQHFIATSALRDANNKNEIIEALANHDIYLNIISGNEEAELLTNFTTKYRSYGVVDIGGGSLDIYVNDGAKSSYASFNLGAVRLLHISAKKIIDEKQKLQSWLENFQSVEIIYGLGGNLRCILEIGNGEKKVSSESYLMLLDKFKKMNNDTLVNNYLIPEDRVDIVPLAGELYKEIMEQLRASYLKSSFWSISNGLIEKIIRESKE